MNLLPQDFRHQMQLRIHKVQQQMHKHNMEAMLISSNANLYYLSGRVFRGYIYLPADGEPLFFVIRPVGLEGENVVYIRKPEQIAEMLANQGIRVPEGLGLEESTTLYTDIVRLRKAMQCESVLNASPLLSEARMTKTEYEIEKMREDGRLQALSYAEVPAIYRQGMTDTQLQIELERVLRLNGCLGFYRVSGPLMETNLGTVLTGDNADNPTPYDFAVGGGGTDPSLPAGAAGEPILPLKTVSIDACGNFNGYQTDMTRVWSLTPDRLPELALKAHQVSIEIHRRLAAVGKPGFAVAEMYNFAVEYARQQGLEEYFMGYSQKAPFIGHGVGIELNELPVLTPRSKHLLEAGMTIAIEPKFVIPGVGPVGIENTYVVTADGLQCLTAMPEEIMAL